MRLEISFAPGNKPKGDGEYLCIEKYGKEVFFVKRLYTVEKGWNTFRKTDGTIFVPDGWTGEGVEHIVGYMLVGNGFGYVNVKDNIKGLAEEDLLENILLDSEYLMDVYSDDEEMHHAVDLIHDYAVDACEMLARRERE
jgi:hypothetical protein